MSLLPGVYSATKVNGTCYYRASITYHGKHISLGSYETENDANKAYLLAEEVLTNRIVSKIEDYDSSHCVIPFHKWVVLINYRDHNIYFKNPIYLKQRYFIYYIDNHIALKFDADDLFYYAHHKIMKRGGHLFVSDYGMQVNILSRYGIKNYAVPGRDYQFSNGDNTDYTYANIEIINRYYGVTKRYEKGHYIYFSKIHINGDYIIGKYTTEVEAAIAYNKATALLNKYGNKKNFLQNYVEGINEIEYAAIYNRIRISKKLRTEFPSLS